MKYYTEDIPLPRVRTIDDDSYDGWATLDYTNGGWLVSEYDYQNATKFVRVMNKLTIPMSDTFEWDAYHDEPNHRVLFFPTIPGQEGQQEEGDTFGNHGVWDDTVRAFVFSEENWSKYMAFHGYEC